MSTLRQCVTIGMLAAGLATVSARANAAPVCVAAGYPAVLEVGQAGAPGSPVLVGGYLVAYNGDGYQQIPLVGSLSYNADGTLDLGWTSHFDFGSGNWYCPVGDMVIKTFLDAYPSYDNTYHGGEPDDVEADCPNSFQGTVEIISCEGLAPFDPSLINPLTKGPNTR